MKNPVTARIVLSQGLIDSANHKIFKPNGFMLQVEGLVDGTGTIVQVTDIYFHRISPAGIVLRDSIDSTNPHVPSSPEKPCEK